MIFNKHIVNRIANIILADEYQYVYDPEHRNKPRDGEFFETEKGWSNDPKDKKQETKQYPYKLTPLDNDYFDAVRNNDINSLQKIVHKAWKNSLLPNDVFYTGAGIEVIRNPSSTDYQQMVQECKEEYPSDKSGESQIRFTEDSKGNRWIWRADKTIHAFMEPAIESKENVKVSQNEFDNRALNNIIKDKNGNIVPLSQRFTVPNKTNSFDSIMSSKKFVKPARAKDAELVWLSTDALERGFRKNDGYVGKGGQGGIGNRYNMFSDFFSKAKSIETPEIVIKPDGEVEFVNGRHRFSYMRDNGATKIPVALYSDSNLLDSKRAKALGF